MRRSPLAAAALTLLTLAGCGGTDSYDTPKDIAAALDKGGVTCANFENIEGAQNAAGRGRCNIGDKQLMLGVYATESDAKAEPGRHSTLPGGLDTIMVVGPNWTVGCDRQEDCDAVVKAIGGELVKIPKP